MSNVQFDDPGAARNPSPSVWKRFRKTLINDLGLGYYRHIDFLGVPTGTPDAGDLAGFAVADGLKLVGEVDLVLSNIAGRVGGVLDTQTGATDNDSAAFLSQPLGPVVRSSQQELAMEVDLEVGDITGDQGLFVGFVEEAGATLDVVADNCATLIGESLFGFASFTADPDAIAAVYRKDADTLVIVKADVTNAAAITTGGGTVSSLVNDTPVKLAVVFDGLQSIRWFVNGIVVATQDVDSTIDQSKDYSFISSLKTGAAAAESFAHGFVRYAAAQRK